jgi:4-hydroxy-3-methylbut-2-enyl diphosphate reductase IspH
MSLDKQPRGLGDQIERFTEATGIKKLVHWAFGEDCGCRERKEYLNRLFPRSQKPECLVEKEYKYLKRVNLYKQTTLSAAHQRGILKIYNRIFKKQREFSSCSSCVITLVNEMKLVLKAYENE